MCDLAIRFPIQHESDGVLMPDYSPLSYWIEAVFPLVKADFFPTFFYEGYPLTLVSS